MFRKYLIPTLHYLTRTAKPQLLARNGVEVERLGDAWLYRPFATTNPEVLGNLEKIAYEDVKQLGNNKNVVIIDVREPNELVEHGVIPGSINIPLGDVEATLKNLSDDQFLKKYGRSKPNEKTPVVFSCMKGMRSEKAQIAALKLGYKNVKNYAGGWNDWAEKMKSTCN